MIATTRRVRRLSAAAALAFAGLVAAPHTSAAAPPPGFFYLSFQDRLPVVGYDRSDWIAYSYVGRRPAALRPRLRLIRNGTVIVETEGQAVWGDDGASAPDLVVGDLLQVQDATTGEVYAQATFDGRPAFNQGVCGAVTELAGLRTFGAEISGVGAYDPKGGANAYGGPDETRIDATFEGDGPGDDFDVEFEKPVKAGFRIWAEQQYAVGDNASVRAFREQRVRACEEPPPTTPQPAPGPPAKVDQRPPVGALTPPKHLSKRLLAEHLKGTMFTVLTDEPGMVDASVVLRTGRNPKAKRKTIGALTQSVKQGKNRVRIPVAAASRKTLKRAAGSPTARLVFTFTLRDAAGNVTVLPSVTLKVPRR